MAIELVIFDIAGTLIEDHDEVTSAFHAAFQKNGIAVTREELREWKGAAKREVIRRFARDEASVEKTFTDFRQIVEEEYVRSLKPIAGAEQAVRELRTLGIKTATITGFYRELRDAILERLGWQAMFEAHISSDDVPKGRPAPDLIFHAMEAAGATAVRKVMVVGDTPLDIQAANNAGAIAVAVLTGVHSKERLEQERYAKMVASVAAIPALLDVYR